MSTERQDSAKKYAKQKRWVFILDFLINGFVALIWVFSGFSIWLREFISLNNFPLIVTNGLFILVYGFVAFVISSPLTYYSEFLLPKRYELSHERLSSWLTDQTKSLAISGAIGIPLLLLIYWFLSIAPQTWWIWAAAIVVTISVLFANLYPVLIAPIFNKFVPLADQHNELEQKLTNLARQANTHVAGVFQFDMSRRTKTANAALMGFSNTKRIVLSDTILENYTDDEIETILAHELAHHVHNDLPLSILVNSVIIILTFFLASFGLQWGIHFFNFASISDIANLPLLEIIFGLFSILVFPIQNTFSRILEKRADTYALKITNKPIPFATALTKLSDQNLAELDPDPWIEFFMHSHPSISKRILMAEQYAENQNE
ncbi:MAG: M48 family metallopeptidase [Anaerolineaceae bacterium]|nr:M48 family metallopeptidase [Anaerolineaceae bacterium]